MQDPFSLFTMLPRARVKVEDKIEDMVPSTMLIVEEDLLMGYDPLYMFDDSVSDTKVMITI